MHPSDVQKNQAQSVSVLLSPPPLFPPANLALHLTCFIFLCFSFSEKDLPLYNFLHFHFLLLLTSHLCHLTLVLLLQLLRDVGLMCKEALLRGGFRCASLRFQLLCVRCLQVTQLRMQQ